MDEVLQSYKEADKMMPYVCRYKLVKETIYKLVPVSWQPGEEELRQTAEFSDFDDRNMYTDTDDQSEAVCDLNESIHQLHLSLIESNGPSKTVTPIKIMKNAVHKVTRSQSQSSKKRSSPDASLNNDDVSPSKRNKLRDESSYAFESPVTQNDKHSSPAQIKMDRAKKNLNDSFTMDEEPRSPYTSIIDEKEPLKMVFSKRPKPLQERNDIATQSPRTRNTEPTYNMARRSILRTTESRSK